MELLLRVQQSIIQQYRRLAVTGKVPYMIFDKADWPVVEVLFVLGMFDEPCQNAVQLESVFSSNEFFL